MNALARTKISAVLGFLAVGLGAMGAHALKATLEASEQGMERWQTAAQYHLVHAVALLVIATRGNKTAWWLMFAGVVLFSGSLYLLAATQVKVFAHTTPVGGLCLMLGWLALLFRRPTQT